MFKKLFNKIMSNENPNQPEQNVPDVSEETETPVETTPGVQVPEGPKVPGTDMSTGITEKPDEDIETPPATPEGGGE